jgi:hypothetical protein
LTNLNVKTPDKKYFVVKVDSKKSYSK